MLTSEEIKEMESKMKQIRHETLEQRRQVNSSWKTLHQSEVEMEEYAQKESISQPLNELDELEKERIEAIDKALHKIHAGIYGSCELCGQDISVQRLRAIPWATLCKTCQWKQENPELASELGPAEE